MTQTQPQRDPETKQFLPGNLFAARSPIYTQSVRSIKEAINDYMVHCSSTETSPTIPGLAYALGFSSRKDLWDFLNRSKTFSNMGEEKRRAVSDTINKVKMAIEAVRVQRLVDGKGSTPGAIFDLKNNFGYSDRIEQVTDTHVHITWGGQDAITIKPVEQEQLPESTDDVGNSVGNDG